MACPPLLEAAGFERLGRVLRDDEVVVAEQVVDVDALGRQELVVLRGCGSSSTRFSFAAVVDDERLLVGLRASPSAPSERLGLDLGELEAVDDDEAAFLGEERERALQRADAHLARRAVATSPAASGGWATTAADEDAARGSSRDARGRCPSACRASCVEPRTAERSLAAVVPARREASCAFTTS